ncbi:Peroxisomal membrane protein 11C [Hondaea fermentalgiana]|uniref:Peroxisomal membrane protein 11C n=1 Tax=Hondaea fermentalgiana TaxID=2315210 RepID=A0A2R5GBK4_9STRA|nr:Peroxisomal membrane protein 11C [Hondaea fermentalgiana]|eukprot:GBG27719.1 Peroxisomal membrane protein 11C [Hondaea fermentalgiana]
MSARLVPKAIKPAELKNVVKFMGDLKARDKLLRLVQYFTKFLVVKLREGDAKSDLAKRVELLSKGIGLHRKAFKVGSWLEEYQKFVELVKNGKDDPKRTMSIILRACMTVFLMLDNAVWLTTLKVADFDKDALKKKAYKFRLTAALLNTAIGVLDFQKQALVVEAAKEDAERVKAEEKQGANVVGLVKNVFDVVTYANSAEVFKAVRGSSYGDDVIGLVGAVSSLAALYGIWIK